VVAGDMECPGISRYILENVVEPRESTAPWNSWKYWKSPGI